MATPNKKVSKKRVVAIDANGQAHIKATFNNIIIKNGMTEIVTSTTTSILLIIHKIRLKMQMVEFGQLISLKSVSDPEE